MKAKKIWAGFLVAVVMSALMAVANAKAAGAETRVRAQLAGAAINGAVPKGQAEFRARIANTQLKLQVEDVNLADGATLNVLVNNNPVGQMTLALRRGSLQLNTGDGDAIPPIGLGSTVVVTNQAGATIVAGSF